MDFSPHTLSPWAGPVDSPKRTFTLMDLDCPYSSPPTPPPLAYSMLRRSAFSPAYDGLEELQWREAKASDVDQIMDLTAALDMSYATSFVWGAAETRRRILTRSPLTIVALEGDVVVGVAGVDIAGSEKPFHVHSIGSRITETSANQRFTIPNDFCLCRGLLVHPDHQGRGVGTLLHRGRLQCLHALAPDTPGVVLSARGSSLEEALAILTPRLNHADPSDMTPQFSKAEIFEFTFRTSLGVVHLAHGKEEQGWKFVGVDESDGGPVWCTCDTLSNIIKASKPKKPRAFAIPPPLPPSPLLDRVDSFTRPLNRVDTAPMRFFIKTFAKGSDEDESEASLTSSEIGSLLAHTGTPCHNRDG